MIRVSSHEEFQNADFDKPSFGQLKYQAIPSNTFTVAMLKQILEAFPNNQAQNSPNKILDLMHAIKNAAEENNWHFSNEYILVGGRGHLYHQLLAQFKPENIHDYEEMANTLIQRHPNILTVLDTDVKSMDSDGTGTRPDLDPSPNDKLNILTDAVEAVRNELAEIRQHNNLQNAKIRQQETLYNQVRGECSTLQDQLYARRKEVTLTPPDSDEEMSSIQCYQTSQFLEDKTCSNRKPYRIRPLENTPSFNPRPSRSQPTTGGREDPGNRGLSSEEINHMEHSMSSQNPRAYKAWTLKKLNIQKFDPEQMDIISHVEKVTKILEEVNVRPESQKIRLLVASLPTTMDHYEKAVPSRYKQNYHRFSRELIKIMGCKVRIASHRFMECHRRRGEDILRFFFRLCDLFKASKGLSHIGHEWETNPKFTSLIYTKLYENLYTEEQTELERRVDRFVESGTLTVARLKKQIIHINKMASSKVRGEVANPKSILTVEALNNSSNDEERDVNVERLDHDIEEEFYYDH